MFEMHITTPVRTVEVYPVYAWEYKGVLALLPRLP